MAEEPFSEAQALDHLITAVFRDDPVIISLFRDENIDDFLSFDALDPSDYTKYQITIGTGENERTIKISRVSLRIIERVQHWYRTVIHASLPNSWRELSREMLSQFLVQDDTLEVESQVTAQSVPEAQQPVVKPFFETIKTSVTDFKELNSDANWQEYKRNLLATATIHRCSEVLSPNYNPPEHLRDVFQDKCRYMYGVFLRTLKTNKSRKHVRHYESEQNGQAVYADLVKEYLTGTDGDLERQRLEKKLRDLRIEKRGPKRTYQDFMNLWETTLFELESIMGSQVPDDEKRRLLTESVRDNVTFNTILLQHKATLSTYRLLAAGTEGINEELLPKSLPFDLVYTSLLDHAKQLDDANKSKDSDNNNSKSNSKKKDKSNNSKSSKNNNAKSDTFKRKKIPPHEWAKMTPAQKKAHNDEQQALYEAWKAKQPSKNRNNQNNNSNSDNNSTNRQVNSTNVNDNGSANNSDVNNAGIQTNAPTLQGSNVQRMLSTTITPGNNSVTFNGRVYHASVMHVMVNGTSVLTPDQESLIDRGASGGFAGNDVRIISTGYQTANVAGVHGNVLPDCPIGTVAGYINSTNGPIIAIMNQYAIGREGPTIHSANQLSYFGIDVDERPQRIGGRQSLKSPDGFEIPLIIKQGLAYMPMRPPTDLELQQLPHIILSSDLPWDPCCLDKLPEEMSEDPQSREQNVLVCINATTVDVFTPKSIIPNKPDYEKLRPLFAWTPADRIRDTLKVTTQWYQAEGRILMRKHFKSRFPAANVRRLNEVVATDTFFATVPAYDDGIPGHSGITMLQLYVGVTSHYIAIYPMRAKSNMPNTLRSLLQILEHQTPYLATTHSKKSVH